MRGARATGWLVGLLAGLVASVALGALRGAAPPERPLALRDSGGRIRSVLLHYDPATAELVLPTYRDVLAALEPDVRVFVAAASRADVADLRRRLADLAVRRDLEPVEVGLPITTWSRDRFVTARRGGRPLLLVPRRLPAPFAARGNDRLVPFRLAAARPDAAAVSEVPMALDGGDLVADERRVYATAAILGRDPAAPLAPDEARELLGQMTGLEPVLLGEGPEEVPAHHIGMLVTPLGGGRVLVGSPGAGARLLSALPEPVAEAADADLSGETAARFARVARALEEAGLEVIEVPLVPTRSEVVYLTWNNVLVDDRGGERHVLVPRYGVEPLDEAGATVWRDLGFVVHPVDVSRVYRSGGAVRCLVAVLDRGEVNRPLGP